MARECPPGRGVSGYESETTFLLPEGVMSGTFMLNAVNKVERGKREVTLP